MAIENILPFTEYIMYVQYFQHISRYQIIVMNHKAAIFINS